MTLEQYCRLPSDERDRICRIIHKACGKCLLRMQDIMDAMVERYMIYDSCWNDQYTSEANVYLEIYNNL